MQHEVQLLKYILSSGLWVPHCHDSWVHELQWHNNNISSAVLLHTKWACIAPMMYCDVWNTASWLMRGGNVTLAATSCQLNHKHSNFLHSWTSHPVKIGPKPWKPLVSSWFIHNPSCLNAFTAKDCQSNAHAWINLTGTRGKVDQWKKRFQSKKSGFLSWTVNLDTARQKKQWLKKLASRSSIAPHLCQTIHSLICFLDFQLKTGCMFTLMCASLVQACNFLLRNTANVSQMRDLFV